MTQAPAKPATLGELIAAQKSGFIQAMTGSTLAEREAKAERFMRICLTAARQTPKLQQCTMSSLAAAMMICAQLNLEPNTPQQLAFLIPYDDHKRHITECQFQIGYKGLLQLVYRSGMIAAFNADVVYRAEIEAGLFHYSSGSCVSIAHERDLLRPELRNGEIVAAYACATLRSGLPIIRLVDRQQVAKAQNSSPSFKSDKKCHSQSSPWTTTPDAMWIKTAIKRLASWLPQNSEVALAVEADDKAERGESLSPEKSATDKLNDVLAGAAMNHLDAPAQETPALEESKPSETIDLSGLRSSADPVTASGQTQPEGTLFTRAPDPSRTITCPKTGAPVDELDCAGKPCRAQCPEFA